MIGIMMPWIGGVHNMLQYKKTLKLSLQEGGRPTTPYKKARETSENSKDGSVVYSCLLKNEVLGYQFEDNKDITSTEKKSSASRKLFHVRIRNRQIYKVKT